MKKLCNFLLLIAFCAGLCNGTLVFSMEKSLNQIKKELEDKIINEQNELKKNIEEYDTLIKKLEETIENTSKNKNLDLNKEIEILKLSMQKTKEFRENHIEKINKLISILMSEADKKEKKLTRKKKASNSWYKKNIAPYFKDPYTALPLISSILPSLLTGYLTKYGYKKLLYIPALALSWYATHELVKQHFEDQENDGIISKYTYDAKKTTAHWAIKALIGATAGESLRIGRTGLVECWKAFVQSRR